ncbi:DUF4968 domain-containing protein [Echinicola shivajiensis]|uniref:DUF4968 domain-containing protein n=1 Tax=Echinicola shivajiensis TaxID=1035916 RepID=UPI00293D7650|nr:DUF4968 domain-containing protein [Echinicola shivajiensis]
MKTKITLLGLAGMLIFAACSKSDYEENQDGIILNLVQKDKKEAAKLRLQVLGDELIHVSATPDQHFPKDTSLIIVPNAQTIPFTVDDTGDSITLSTARLNVRVSKSDGGIIFKDKDNRRILAEAKGGAGCLFLLR